MIGVIGVLSGNEGTTSDQNDPEHDDSR